MTLDLRINERLKLCIPNILKSEPCMANKQTEEKKTEQNRGNRGRKKKVGMVFVMRRRHKHDVCA